MNILLQQLKTYLDSSLGVLGVILLVSFIMVWYVSKYIERFKGLSNEIKSIKEGLSSLKDMVIGISHKVDLMYKNFSRTIQSNSPLSLTKIGEKSAENLNVRHLVDDLISKNIDAIEKIKTRDNAYDIQTECMTFASGELLKHLSKEEVKNIKNEAYHQGLLEDEILSIFGVVLRDKILEELNISSS